MIPLGPEHWDGALALVAEAGLPTADLVSGRQQFWGTFEGDHSVGVIAWERVGAEALVRSFVVRPDRRGGGLGAALYLTLEDEARAAGLQRLVLLTETPEFSSLCPVSAAVLAKDLA